MILVCFFARALQVYVYIGVYTHTYVRRVIHRQKLASQTYVVRVGAFFQASFNFNDFSFLSLQFKRNYLSVRTISHFLLQPIYTYGRCINICLLLFYTSRRTRGAGSIPGRDNCKKGLGYFFMVSQPVNDML